MPASAIIDIQSNFTDTGTNAATEGVNKVGASVNATSGKMEGLFRRMEKPLGRTLFSTLATGLLGVGEGTRAASGGVMALERGFHALAMGASFAGGPLGTIILLGAALVATFLKIHDSSKDTAEGIKKEVDSLAKQRDEYKESSKVLLKMGVINENQAKTLQDLSKARQGDIDKIKETIRQQIRNLELSKISDAEIEKASHTYEGATGRLRANAAIQERINEITKNSVGLLGEETNALKQRSERIALANEEMRLNYEMIVKVAEETHSYSTILKMQKDAQAELIEADNAYRESFATNDKAIIEGAKSRMEAVKNEVAVIGAAYQRLEAMQNAMASQFNKVNSAIASNFKKVNGQIVFDFQKFASTMVADVADMISKQLVMWGTMDILTGNIGKGVAELAGAAAVAALGGIAGTWGPGEQASAGLATASTNGGGVSQETQGPNQVTLNVNIQGGLLDQNSAAYVARALNDWVQQSNGVLISSNLVQAYGQAPGI